jgi:hypothetical protein
MAGIAIGMAKPRGPGKKFTKGQSGNPDGSSKLSKLKHKLRGLSLEEVLLQGRILLEDTDPDVCHKAITAPGSSLALRLLATMAAATTSTLCLTASTARPRSLWLCPATKMPTPSKST